MKDDADKSFLIIGDGVAGIKNVGWHIIRYYKLVQDLTCCGSSAYRHEWIDKNQKYNFVCCINCAIKYQA